MTGKDVLLDDGLFEVTLIQKPRNPIELAEILRCLTTGVDDTELIYSTKTDRIRLTSPELVPWTMDGEYGGDHTEVEIHNERQAVNIMVDEV